MTFMTWKEIQAATGGQLLHGKLREDDAFAGITTDTRKVRAGDLFVALRGEKFDGADFAEDALRAGAVGVMQLMPETAAGLGVNPYDMKSNVEGGAKYLREMLDTFDGDVKKAVAAYNAGPNAVKAYGGVPPYAETQNYVSSVLDIYR